MTPKWGRLAVVLMLAVVLGGCAMLSAERTTRSKLKGAGYDATLSVDETNGFTTATVGLRRAPADPEAAPERAACIVWKSFPYRIDAVSISGAVSDMFLRSDLVQACGPRPAGYDDKTIGSTFLQIGKGVAIGAGIGCLALVVAGVVLGVVLLRRSRRRRASPSPPGYGGSPPAGYPPPPGGGYAAPPTPYGAPPAGLPAWGSPPPIDPPPWGPQPGAPQPEPRPEPGPWTSPPR